MENRALLDSVAMSMRRYAVLQAEMSVCIGGEAGPLEVEALDVVWGFCGEGFVVG